MILRKVINCLWLPARRIVDRESILTEKELRAVYSPPYARARYIQGVRVVAHRSSEELILRVELGSSSKSLIGHPRLSSLRSLISNISILSRN